MCPVEENSPHSGEAVSQSWEPQQAACVTWALLCPHNPNPTLCPGIHMGHTTQGSPSVPSLTFFLGSPMRELTGIPRWKPGQGPSCVSTDPCPQNPLCTPVCGLAPHHPELWKRVTQNVLLPACRPLWLPSVPWYSNIVCRNIYQSTVAGCCAEWNGAN